MIQQLAPKGCFDLREADPGIVHVDVRTPEEFAAGHPVGSFNVPVFFRGPGGMQPNPRFLEVVQRLAPPDQRLILSCAAGGRSQRAAEALANAGYQQLVNMTGGFQGQRSPAGELVEPGWQDAGLPVAHEVGASSWEQLSS